MNMCITDTEQNRRNSSY